MSGALVNIKVEDKEVKDLFARMKERGKDLLPAMKVSGQIVRTSVVKNFEEGGRPEKWKPLSLATLFAGKKGKFAGKRGRFRKGVEERFKNRKLLIDTGRLMNSINARPFPDRAEVGASAIYAAIHQFGGKAGVNRQAAIPARPFLMVQGEDWTEIRNCIVKHLMEG